MADKPLNLGSLSQPSFPTSHLAEKTDPQTFTPPIIEHPTHCEEAWRCLSVGCFSEAQRRSRAKNDVVCMAASLTMSGNKTTAITILEGYIIATSVVAYEKRLHPLLSEEQYILRLNEIIVAWMGGPEVGEKVIGASVQARSEDEYYEVMQDVCSVVNWDLVRRWFLIALFLYEGKEYQPPSVMWFHFFFALFTRGTPVVVLRNKRLNKTMGVCKISPQHLNQNDIEDILLAQCEENEVHLISAITAWKTQRYRSAISSATRFLDVEELGYEITDANMRTMTLFIRCMSLIQIGERTLAANDCVKILRDDNDFLNAVGASIAAFLLPLPSAVNLISSFQGTIKCKQYAFALCEYVHALTLVQLGCMEAAASVIQASLPFASMYDVGEWLLDLLVVVCTALEDSTTILQQSLSPQRQLYIAMCPVFFGGLRGDVTKIRSNTPAGRLLYPKNIPTCASVRQMIPFHLNRAHHFFSKRKYIEAWTEVCLAVGSAEEIVGSVEFAFTDCSPLKTYYFGCCVGMEVLQTLLEVMAFGDTACSTINSAYGTTKNLFEEGVALCEEVIKKCSQWTCRLRQFFPNVRLGSVALSRYLTTVHTENFISRAICFALRYPNYVLAQNCLTFALYANHHIPEAVDNAAKAMQRFPHSRIIIDEYRRIVEKDGVYVFNYRTLVPVHYAPGSDRLWTKRLIVVLILIFFHIMCFLLTVMVNMPGRLHFSDSLKELAVRVQLPSVIPLFYAVFIIVYAVLATVSQQNMVRSIMRDLFFKDTRMNRFLFPMRGIALVNTFNAMQITIAGNNFLFDSHWYTFFLYLLLAFVLVPFTSRVWFLPSVDEPNDSRWTWLTLLAVDTLSALLLIVPHIILFALEPLMFIAFFFFHSQGPSDGRGMTGNVGRRLRLHKKCLSKSKSPYIDGNKSQFIHIRLMALLYYKTHSDLTTKKLMDYQIDEDNYRVFPLIEVYEPIPTRPIELSSRKSIVVQNKRRNIMEYLVNPRYFITGHTNSSLLSDDSDYDDCDSNKQEMQRVFRGLFFNTIDADKEENTVDMDHDLPNGSNAGFEEQAPPQTLTQMEGKEYDMTAHPKGDKSGDLSAEMESSIYRRNRVLTIADAFSTLPDKDRVHMERSKNKEISNADHRRKLSDPKEKSTFDDSQLSNKEKKKEEEKTDEETIEQTLSYARERGPQRLSLRSSALEYLSLLAQTYSSSTFPQAYNPLSLTTQEEVKTSGDFTGIRNFSFTAFKRPLDPRHPCIPSLSFNRPSRDTSLVNGVEMSVSHADPVVVPDEEAPLLSALQLLYESMTSILFRSASEEEIAQLKKRKDDVEKCLKSLPVSHLERFPVKDPNCLQLCCKVVSKMVEIGDNPSNPLTVGSLSLVKVMLARVDSTEIYDTILLNGLLEDCVIHGYVKMLRAVLTPSCVQVMKYIHWNSLLQSFETDMASLKVESFGLILDAFQHVRLPSIKQKVIPLFQSATEFTLHSNASEVSQKSLEDLLRRIKSDAELKVDFWQVEGMGGRTIFSNACTVGNLQLIKALWSLGLVGNVNRVQSDGTNALMQAVMHERRNVVLWFCSLPPHVTAESFTYRHPEHGTVFEMSNRNSMTSVFRNAMPKWRRKSE